MTNLRIIPNFEKKTAKFEGVIAAGEKIHATIENVGGFIASTQNLRLRAVASDGGTLAIFPQENELGEVIGNWSFEGDTIKCDLNLNTVQMLKVVPPAARVMVLFVLDNPEDETLYFKSFCEVDHWPRRVGEEEPVDLGGYADFVQDAKQSIKDAEAAIKMASSSAQSAADSAGRAEESAKAAQESATGSVGSAATYASEAEKARDEANSRANSASTFANNAKASQTAAESAKSAAESARDEAKGYAESAESTLANAATKAELQAEVERATAAEEKNAAAIDETSNALVAETERAKTAEQNLANEVSEVGDKVDTLVAGDTKKSARAIAAEEVAKVVANAPADLDTLKEIAEYIKSDKTGAAQMVTQIDANAKAISAEEKRATDAETALAGRVKELEENGGGSTDSSPVLVPCTVEEIGSVIKINPTKKAPQASYYVNDKLNIGESVSRTWVLGLEFYLSVADPADFSTVYREFVKQTLEPDEYTILEELTGSGYDTTGQVRIRIEKDVIIKDKVYGDIIQLRAGSISGAIVVDYGVMDDGSIFLSPIFDALSYYFNEWDFIHPDGYLMTVEDDCLDLYTASVESRKINGEIILPDSFSNIRHSWFISFENGVNPHGYITFKGENEGVFIDAQSNSNRSNVFAGRNVWQIVEVAEEIFSVNRICPCSEDSITLSSPSGRQAQLTVNDELVLEVKEV